MLESCVDQAHGLQALQRAPARRAVAVVAGVAPAAEQVLLRAIQAELAAQRQPTRRITLDLQSVPESALVAPERARERWAQALPPGGVALLHAPLEALAVLFEGSTARPLIALDAQADTLVRAYNALKVLVQMANLQPILMPIGKADAAVMERAARTLQRCCLNRLNHLPMVWPLEYHGRDLRSWSDAPPPWLNMVLESAWQADEVAR